MFGKLGRLFARIPKRFWKWFLVGEPINYLFPSTRQRLNRHTQERRNLREWLFADSYFRLSTAESYIFMHIPKTAGTYIARELISNADFEWLNPTQQPKGNRFIIPHYSIEWLIKNRILSQGFVSEAKVFTVVREPRERLFSAYRYLQRMGHVSEAWSYDKFLLYLRQENPSIGGARVSRMSHAAPQSLWLEQRLWNGPEKIFRLQDIQLLNLWLGECIPWFHETRLTYRPRFATQVKEPRTVELESFIIQRDVDYFSSELSGEWDSEKN